MHALRGDTSYTPGPNFTPCIHTPVTHFPLHAQLMFSFTAQKASAAAHAGVDTRGAFKMAVWLTVYYDFFDKNVRHLHIW